MSSDFRNVTVRYSEIIDVRYYVYRSSEAPYHKRREISIGTELGIIAIRSTRAQRQFLEKLELPFRDTQGIYDWKERDSVLMDALRKRREREQKGEVYPLVFRCQVMKNRDLVAWSVVTTEYQEIPVYEVQSTFEAIIQDQKLTPQLLEDWQDSGIHFYRYKILDSNGLPLVTKFSGEQADFCMILRVGFAGDRAISIVPSWSLQTLLSKHYITSKKSAVVFRAVHRYLSKDEILKLMGEAVKQVLDKSVLKEPEIALKPSYETVHGVFLSYRNKYPIHVKDQLDKAWERYYNTENGYVRAALALSDIGKNYENLSTAQRLNLEQDAFRALELL